MNAEDRRRCYLDHAATGWPKPPGVVEAMVRYQQELGSSIGRSPTTRGMECSRLVQLTRQSIGKWIGTQHADNIALLSSGTQALNAAIFGWLQAGDHVVTTKAEHNSLLRPLACLAKSRDIRWDAAEIDAVGRIEVASLDAKLLPDTRLVAFSHASNVTGVIQPLQEILSLVRRRAPEAWVLLDAAQSFGIEPLEVDRWGIEMLAAPGHKSAGGMQGTGFLYVHPRLQDSFSPPWIGGTGEESQRIDGPFHWLSVLESGNQNGPAIASLHEGLTWLTTESTKHRDKLYRLSERLREILIDFPCFELVGPDSAIGRVPIYSVRTSVMTPQEWQMVLDGSYGIEVRAGLHCAGWLHQSLGTLDGGGTLRFSLGHTSQPADLDQLSTCLKEIAKSLPTLLRDKD